MAIGQGDDYTRLYLFQKYYQIKTIDLSKQADLSKVADSNAMQKILLEI